MRATRYWLIGRSEIQKFLQRLSNFESKNDKKNLPTTNRYFNQRFQLHGESLLSALVFTNQKKETSIIVELALKLDPSGELEKIISEEKSNFLSRLTHKQIFFCLIILCELDDSETIVFDTSYATHFQELFNKPNDFLKKTYLCE